MKKTILQLTILIFIIIQFQNLNAQNEILQSTSFNQDDTLTTDKFDKKAKELIEQKFKEEQKVYEKHIDRHLALFKELSSKIEQDRNIFEQQSDRHFQSLNKTIESTQNSINYSTNLIVLVLTGIFIIASAIFIYLFGKQMKDIEPKIESTIKSLAHKIMNEKIEDYQKEMDKLIFKYNSLVSYRNKHFAWFFSSDEVTADLEIEVLHYEGIRNLDIISDFNFKKINIEKYEMIIFSYDGTPEAKSRLHHLIKLLKSIPNPIFLVMYTYNNGNTIRLDKNEQSLLSSYDWVQICNFPPSIVSFIKTIIR